MRRNMPSLAAVPLSVLGALSAPAHAANRAPVIEEASFFTDEDKPLHVMLKASDGDGDALTFRMTKPPKNGTASIASDGNLTYTPKANWHGKEELTFEVTDGKKAVTRKAEIAVSSVNDPPTAPPIIATGAEDKQLRGQVSAKDADGDPIFFTVAEGPKKGALDVDRAGKWTFTPAPDEHGSLSLSIKMSDGTSDVTVPLNIVVEPQNDAPTVKEQNLKTKEDEKLTAAFKASDVDGDALTFTITEKPAHGAVELDGKGGFTYVPAKEYAGDDAFGYAVSDGKLSAKGRVEVEVDNVNDPPTIFTNNIETNEDTPVKGKVNAKDFDGDTIYYAIKVEAKHGDAEIDHLTGDVTYTPKQDFFGTDAITVEASDIAGGVTAVMNINIKPVNDAPVPAADNLNFGKGDEDTVIAGKLKASDIDKDPLTFALAKPPRSGALTIAGDGAFKFTPNANFHGEDTAVFEVTDGKGGKGQGTLSLTVKPVNDGPKAADIALSSNEDVAVRGKVVGTDIDGDKLSYSVGKAATKGTATVDEETGAVAYQPGLHQNGNDSFTIKVSDGTAEHEVSVTVALAAVNDVPVAEKLDVKSDEDATAVASVKASDVDKDTLSYTVIAKPKNGTVDMDPSTGSFKYTPRAHYFGDDAFRYEVSDGKLKASADVKLAIAAVNDAPDVKPVAVRGTEDKPLPGALPASDIDKDKLTWTEAKAPTKGKVALDAAKGTFTYTPNLDANGEDSFVIAVGDGKASTEATVSVALEPVNDVPVVEKHEGRGNEDSPITGKLVGRDVDPDTLTFTAVTKPSRGVVDVNPQTGAFTYTPRAHENGEDGFKFEVSDGKLKASADVKLTVIPVNDAPEAKALTVSTTEDKDATGRIVSNDIDKDALTFRLKKPPAKGIAIVDDASGAVRYVPSRDVNGQDTFVVETSDGFATVDATVTVDVVAAPDAPVVDAKPIETAEDEPVVAKLTALDADAGEDVTFKILQQPKIGEATLEGDGKTVRFTPRADAHGEDALIVEATDGKHKVRASIPVLVAARNDAPWLDLAKAETPEETAVVVALAVHDKDGDPVKLALDRAGVGPPVAAAPKPAATTTASAAPAKGAAPAAPAAKVEPRPVGDGHDVTLNGSILRVVPRRDFAGQIEVDVVPSDGSVKGAPLKVVVNVVNVNDAPVVKDASVKGVPEKPVSGGIEASDVDTSYGDELAFSLAVQARQGTAVLEDTKTGKWTYTAKPDAKGEDSFRIRVKDKAGASATATVKVTFGAATTTSPDKPAPAAPPAKPVASN